jgi:hypothetical protein
MRQLILASGESLTSAEQRLLKLADWMGVPTKAVAWRFLDEVDGPLDGLAMSAETLAQAHKASPQHLERLVQQRCRSVLVFGCDDPERHAGGLSWLTGGKVAGLSSPQPGPDAEEVFDLPRPGRDFSRQLAGLSFSTRRGQTTPTFDQAPEDPSLNAIMLLNRRSVFVHLAVASCEVFLWAGSEMPDINEPLSAETGLEAHYDRLIPLLVFLRHSFGEMCWHGPERTARFIIDDPLLAERYGFLDYRALLNSMRRAGYATSIAFIPWNYRRTSSRTAARLFGQRPDFSLCVHGCDHTNREFDGADQALLERKAGLALERMKSHQTRTGLAFEQVMVFPQGWFSTDAMRALRSTDYLAAVNSTCFPTDDKLGPLTIAELLRPAVTRFHGFPIFHRRYPRNIFDSAFDMFLGKPALLVEHPQYFREGCEPLEQFVKGLRTVEPSLSWPPLSSQLMRSCHMRAVAPGSVEVQFYTRRFRLENADVDRRHYRLSKHEPDPFVVREVRVDGSSTPFSRTNGFVELELEADPGQTRHIEILDHPGLPRNAQWMGVGYNVGVFMRRRLSEFRDNTLARHPKLLRAATRLAREARLTGARRDRATGRKSAGP